MSGALLSERWVDAAQDEDRPKRVHAPRLYPRQPYEAAPGMECAPSCLACGSATVWRGRWECVGCDARGVRQGLSLALLPSSLPREALAGVPVFSTSEGNNSTTPAWRYAVESLTSFHRARVATRLRSRGTRVREFVDDDGVVRGEVFVSTWHQQRIEGQAERFERVAECGTYAYALDVTDERGKVTTRPLRKRCDCWRVCQRCLNRRRWKLQTGMAWSRERAMRVHRSQLHARYRGPERAWSEKLITFTVPHGPHGPADDARVLVDAWQKILRKIRAHLAARGAVRVDARGKRTPVSVPWNRALEVGTRGEHHAHLHVWWLGPFLDATLLQAWWGQILADMEHPGVMRQRVGDALDKRRARGAKLDARLLGWLGGSEDAVLPWGIVDIRSDRSHAGTMAAYAQKVGVSLYVSKGVETAHMEPAHVASIYEVFEGVRAVQWARGWAPPKVPMRAACVTFRRLTEEEKNELNKGAFNSNKCSKSHEKAEEKDQKSGLATGTDQVHPDPHASPGPHRPREQMALPGFGTP